MNEKFENYRAIGQQIAQQIADLIAEQTKEYSKKVTISVGGLCPEIVFIRIEALNEKDIPHNISENSVYMGFSINLINESFECIRTGHIYLSEADKKTDKYKYLCMRSMSSIGVDNGVKKFRKSKHKNVETTAKKIADYFNAIMPLVDKYSGGYPYKA